MLTKNKSKVWNFLCVCGCVCGCGCGCVGVFKAPANLLKHLMGEVILLFGGKLFSPVMDWGH